MDPYQLIPFSASKGETANHRPNRSDVEISIIENNRRDNGNNTKELTLSEFDFSDQMSSNMPFHGLEPTQHQEYQNKQPQTVKQQQRRRLQHQKSYVIGQSSQSPDEALIKSFAEQDKDLLIPAVEDEQAAQQEVFSPITEANSSQQIFTLQQQRGQQQQQTWQHMSGGVY